MNTEFFPVNNVYYYDNTYDDRFIQYYDNQAVEYVNVIQPGTTNDDEMNALQNQLIRIRAENERLASENARLASENARLIQQSATDSTLHQRYFGSIKESTTEICQKIGPYLLMSYENNPLLSCTVWDIYTILNNRVPDELSDIVDKCRPANDYHPLDHIDDESDEEVKPIKVAKSNKQKSTKKVAKRQNN